VTRSWALVWSRRTTIFLPRFQPASSRGAPGCRNRLELAGCWNGSHDGFWSVRKRADGVRPRTLTGAPAARPPSDRTRPRQATWAARRALLQVSALFHEDPSRRTLSSAPSSRAPRLDYREVGRDPSRSSGQVLLADACGPSATRTRIQAVAPPFVGGHGTARYRLIDHGRAPLPSRVDGASFVPAAANRRPGAR
jgi:hypothetical protein